MIFTKTVKKTELSCDIFEKKILNYISKNNLLLNSRYLLTFSFSCTEQVEEENNFYNRINSMKSNYVSIVWIIYLIPSQLW